MSNRLCEYCHVCNGNQALSDTYEGKTVIEQEVDGTWYVIEYKYVEANRYEINHCPMCGERLKED